MSIISLEEFTAILLKEPPMNEKEKIWLRDRVREEVETRMGISILEQVQAVTGSLKPKGWKKAFHIFKEWAPLGGVITVVIALCAIIVTLVIAVTNRREADATFHANTESFQKQTGTRLDNIERDIFSLRLEISSAQPLRSENQTTAKAILAQAKSKSLQIPAAVVEQAGKNFIDAAQKEQTAWPVALDFVAYRSDLNIQFRPTDKWIPLQETIQWTFHPVEIGGKPRPEFNFVKGVGTPPNEAAIYDKIGANLRNLPLGPPILVAFGGATSLDGEHIKNTFFVRVEVHYAGGPLILENAVFINCTFVIENNEPGRHLVEDMLASAKVTFKNAA